MGAVVLFDGICNFCDASVNFVIDHDRAGYFKFAALQSDAGDKIARKYGISSAVSEQQQDNELIPIDSLILVEDGKTYTHSTGALKIARHLEFPWNWLYATIIVPQPIRDLFYRLFAKYRYRLFGRKEECMLPSPEVRQRFLT